MVFRFQASKCRCLNACMEEVACGYSKPRNDVAVVGPHVPACGNMGNMRSYLQLLGGWLQGVILCVQRASCHVFSSCTHAAAVCSVLSTCLSIRVEDLEVVVSSPHPANKYDCKTCEAPFVAIRTLHRRPQQSIRNIERIAYRPSVTVMFPKAHQARDLKQVVTLPQAGCAPLHQSRRFLLAPASWGHQDMLKWDKDVSKLPKMKWAMFQFLTTAFLQDLHAACSECMVFTEKHTYRFLYPEICPDS